MIASGFVLLLMFLRRFWVTRRDLIFQKNLEEEQALEKESKMEAELDMEAEQQKNELPEQVRQSEIRKAFAKADTHFSRGKYEEAEPVFLEIIERDSGHLDAHHKLGMLYMKVGNFPQAELYFSKLVNMKKDPVYYSNLGAALYEQQRLVEAAEAYENAVSLDDKRAARLQSLAQVYFELGDDEKALKYFELAARRKPKDATLKQILADYYERLGRYQEAAALLESVLEMNPYNEEVKALLTAIKGRL